MQCRFVLIGKNSCSFRHTYYGQLISRTCGCQKYKYSFDSLKEPVQSTVPCDKWGKPSFMSAKNSILPAFEKTDFCESAKFPLSNETGSRVPESKADQKQVVFCNNKESIKSSTLNKRIYIRWSGQEKLGTYFSILRAGRWPRPIAIKPSTQWGNRLRPTLSKSLSFFCYIIFSVLHLPRFSKPHLRSQQCEYIQSIISV